MRTASLTIQAEPDFIDALHAFADSLGMSVSSAVRSALAPLISYHNGEDLSVMPKNNLSVFCGCLKDVDCTTLQASQKDFSTIDPELWK